MALTVETEHLFGNLEPFVHEYGAATVMVILTFESLGAPLPGESLLIFASVLAGRGELPLAPLMLGAWTGAVLGDNIGYLIGRWLGRAIVLRYGAKIGINGGSGLAATASTSSRARLTAASKAGRKWLGSMRSKGGASKGPVQASRSGLSSTLDLVIRSSPEAVSCQPDRRQHGLRHIAAPRAHLPVKAAAGDTRGRTTSIRAVA